MFLDELKDILLPFGMLVDKREVVGGYEYFFEFPAPWSGLNFFFLRYSEPKGICEFYPQYKNANKFIYHNEYILKCYFSLNIFGSYMNLCRVLAHSFSKLFIYLFLYS